MCLVSFQILWLNALNRYRNKFLSSNRFYLEVPSNWNNGCFKNIVSLNMSANLAHYVLIAYQSVKVISKSQICALI